MPQFYTNGGSHSIWDLTYLLKIVEHVKDLPDSSVEPYDVAVLLVHLITREQFYARLARDERQATKQGNGGRPRGQSVLPSQAIQEPKGEDRRKAMVKPLHRTTEKTQLGSVTQLDQYLYTMVKS